MNEILKLIEMAIEKLDYPTNPSNKDDLLLDLIKATGEARGILVQAKSKTMLINR